MLLLIMKKVLLSLGLMSLTTTVTILPTSCNSDEALSDNLRNEKIKETTIRDLKLYANTLKDEVTSSKDVDFLTVLLTGLESNAEVDSKMIGLPQEYIKMPPGMHADYTLNTPYDSVNDTFKINFKLISNDNNGWSFTKVITVGAKYYFTNEKAYFHDVNSTKSTTELLNDVNWRMPTFEQLGITKPILHRGTSMTYKLPDNFFSGSGPKIITAILKHGTGEAKVQFKFLPRPADLIIYDFSSDIAKFIDRISTKTTTQLNLDVQTTHPTPSQLGFSEPTLSSDTTASYSTSSSIFKDYESKIIYVTLTHNGEMTNTSFNLMPKVV